jgi:hypothetical protein
MVFLELTLDTAGVDECSGTIRELDNGKLIFGVELLDNEVEIGEVVTIVREKEDNGGTARGLFVEELQSI